MTETCDPRSDLFGNSIRKEIEGLTSRNSWKIVSRNKVLGQVNVFKEQVGLAITDEVTAREV